MYAKPQLVRYGTFRELTLIGTGADGDAGILGFLDGCNIAAYGDCGSDDRS